MPVARCTRTPPTRLARLLRATACSAAVLLAACGGGGGSDDPVGSCSIADQQDWLRGYMDDWYFWYSISPNPSPSGFSSVESYFEALLYTGSSPDFPADRWSGYESTESFNRFYGDGKTLGYGVSVAGAEVEGQPSRPLYVRYVEAQSPAATAGLVRGDQVLAVNGRAAADVIASNDYGALVPDEAGDVLTLQVRNAGGDRTVTLSAAVFGLTPVPGSAIVTSPQGRKLGYVQVKDMIDQALTPLDSAFAQFKAAGVQELVIDLRYNGGGLVSVASALGSYAIGADADGQVAASLLYNDRHRGSNQTYRFAGFTQSLGVSRVYVLAGSRTCSASELLVNGLRPFVDVVLIGDTTCGKPVGFVPEGYCDTTYSAVNFESVNADNEGRYFDGFDATCPVAEDFTQPLGARNEPLLSEAVRFADVGVCSLTAQATKDSARALKAAGIRPTRPLREPGERREMVGR